jgi:hypothetical protein
MSRRQTFRAAAGVLLAAVLPSWVWRVGSARAGVIGATGTCPSKPQEPCNGMRAAWTSGCGGAVASGRPSTYNGCGPESGIDVWGLFKAEPPDDPLFLADFGPSCNGHDCCYGGCNADKTGCDSDFLKGMLTACLKNSAKDAGLIPGIGEMLCAQIAIGYWSAVSQTSAANDAYDAAQKQACDCCYVYA